MISHGIVSGALFLCVGVVYDRMHTREIAAYGGLVKRMPLYAVAMLIFTMANVGLPGTSGFVGEFLAMLGAFKANPNVAFFSTFGIILSAAMPCGSTPGWSMASWRSPTSRASWIWIPAKRSSWRRWWC